MKIADFGFCCFILAMALCIPTFAVAQFSNTAALVLFSVSGLLVFVCMICLVIDIAKSGH